MKNVFLILLFPFSMLAQKEINATTQDLKGNCCVNWHFNEGVVEIDFSDKAADIGHLESSYIFEKVIEPTSIGKGNYHFIIYNMYKGGNLYGEGISLKIAGQTGECIITYSPDDNDETNPTLEFRGQAYNY